jgi:hypothetical protein
MRSYAGFQNKGDLRMTGIYTMEIIIGAVPAVRQTWQLEGRDEEDYFGWSGESPKEATVQGRQPGVLRRIRLNSWQGKLRTKVDFDLTREQMIFVVSRIDIFFISFLCFADVVAGICGMIYNSVESVICVSLQFASVSFPFEFAISSRVFLPASANLPSFIYRY